MTQLLTSQRTAVNGTLVVSARSFCSSSSVLHGCQCIIYRCYARSNNVRPMLVRAQVALLQALNAVIAGLDDIDDEVLRLCSLAAGRIVSGWIYLWPKQYPAARGAIAGVLMALESKSQSLLLFVQQLAGAMLAKTLATPDPAVLSGEHTSSSACNGC